MDSQDNLTRPGKKRSGHNGGRPPGPPKASAAARRMAPIDWIVWPSGNLSLAFRCGHVITRTPDIFAEDDDISPGTGKTCAQCRAERKERAE